MRILSRKSSRSGISLVEIIMVIAAIIVLAMLVTNLPKSVGLITRSQHTSIAKDIATKQMSVLRSKEYSTLSNGTNSFANPQLSALSSAQANYTIGDCPIAVCSNNEVMKQIVVTITWKESGENKTVELSSLVTDGGIGK